MDEAALKIYLDDHLVGANAVTRRWSDDGLTVVTGPRGWRSS